MTMSTSPLASPARIRRLGRGAGPSRQELDAHRPVPEQRPLVPDAEALEHRPHGCCVLLCEHLGRRHQRALVAALDRGEQCGDRDDGLAGADVALQQPVHRHRPGQVLGELGERTLLGSCEREREVRHESLDQSRGHRVAFGGGMGDAHRGPLDVDLALHQRQLEAEQLVEDQPLTRADHVGHRLGPMDPPERIGTTHEIVAHQQLSRHRIGQAPAFGASQRLGDPFREVPGRHRRLLRQRVDRHDATRARPEQVDHRVGHLSPTGEQLDPAEDRDLAPVAVRPAELAFAPRLVEEGAAQRPAVVAQLGGDHGPAAPDPPRRHRRDPSDDQRVLARHQRRHARLVGPVDVAAGVVRQQGVQVVDAELGESAALGGADPAEAVDRHLCELSEPDRVLVTHRFAAAFTVLRPARRPARCAAREASRPRARPRPTLPARH